MNLALAVPHTPWVIERQKSFARLMCQLGQLPELFKAFTDKEANWSWSEKLWQWGIDSGASHTIQLQDDVIVDANFWPNLRAMVDAVPDQIIGLESVHPISRHLYEQGASWYTTSDGLIGVAYVIPRAVLVEFETWRLNRLRPGWQGNVSEDTMIDLFCLSTGRKVWHPVPTIVDHDVAIESTYGNDWHSHRKPIVTTVRGAEPHGWCRDDEPFHVGRFYEHSPRMCRRWVKGFHMADLEAAMRDKRT